MLGVIVGFFRWIFQRFINAFNWIFTLVALLIILLIALSIIGTIFRPTLPAQMVLTLDLRGQMTDQPRPVAFPFSPQPPSVVDTVLALQKAEGDERVKGVFIRMGGGGMSYGHAQDLRDALKAFKAKGKFVIGYAHSFGATDLSEYYIAALADEIWLQPTGDVAVAGIARYAMFLRSLFDKIGAVPEFEQRRDYKNAANMFMQSDYTPFHREANYRLIEVMFETATSDIAAERGLQKPQLVALLNGAPHSADEALAAKLIDKTGFDDDALKAALDRAGADAEKRTLAAYYGLEGSPYSFPMGGAPDQGKIALVFGEGGIADGKGEADPLTGESGIGGDTIAKAIRDATEDETVKAIVFRVSSPGGSATASDQILDALRKAQAAGKPVVISMGPVAASGGYWVSMYADKIFAQPLTITGSIGVLAGKISFGEVYDFIGVNYRALSIGGPLATMFNTVQPFDEAQRAALAKFVDEIYVTFKEKVSEGRKFNDLNAVEAIAQGRVWIGSDAMDRKLIDAFGGLRTALAEAAKLAKLADTTTFEVVVFPAPKSTFEAFADFMGAAANGVRVLGAAAAILNDEVVRAIYGAATEDGRPEPRMEPVDLR